MNTRRTISRSLALLTCHILSTSALAQPADRILEDLAGQLDAEQRAVLSDAVDQDRAADTQLRILGTSGALNYDTGVAPSAIAPASILSLAPSDAQPEINPDPQAITSIRVVSIDWSMLRSIPGADLPRFTVPAFGGRQYELAVVTGEHRAEDRFTWIGQIAGVPASQFILVREGDALWMDVTNMARAEHLEVRFRPATTDRPERHIMQAVSPNARAHAGCATCNGSCEIPTLGGATRPPRHEPGGYSERADPIDSVDIMFIATPEAVGETGSGNGFRARCEGLRSSFDVACAASGVPLRMRIMCATPDRTLNIPENASGEAELNEISYYFRDYTFDDNGAVQWLDYDGRYDAVQAQRIEFRADLLCLLRAEYWPLASPTTAGIAWRPTNASQFDPDHAASVVTVGPDEARIFCHEVGHNFGACHDAATQGGNCTTAGGIGSNGFIATHRDSFFPCLHKYFDIMSYTPARDGPCGVFPVTAFAGPNVTVMHQGTVPLTLGSATANAAGALTYTRSFISQHFDASSQVWVVRNADAQLGDGTLFQPFASIRDGVMSVSNSAGNTFGLVRAQPGLYDETGGGAHPLRLTDQARIVPSESGLLIIR